MNTIIKSLITITTLSMGASAFGQGLVSLRPNRDEFERKLPFTVTVDVGAGYDSNTNLSSTDKNSSGYLQAGVGTEFRGGDRRTSYGISASYGAFYYLDPAPDTNEYMQSARLGFNLRHKFSERTTLTDSAYVAYEFEPNYAVGSGTTRRSQEYLYYYNDIAISHAWSRTFSTITGYTFTGMDYQEDSLDGENYMTHVFHHEFLYALSKLTSVAVDYRFALANYDNGFGDYKSHYYLVGLNHNFDRRTFGTFRVGAETRERDNGGSDTNPYFEGNLSYRADKHTTFNAYARYGFEDSSIGSYQRRESWRTGLTATHGLTTRLSATAGLHYIHDTFDESADAAGYDEDVFSVSIGLNYALYKNISLTSSYGYTTTASGNELREYDRHNVSLGLRASF
jgi:hypothetical protein